MPSTKFPRYKNKTDLCNDLADLGWDYTAGRMSRSGMEIYDMIMTKLGVLEDGEHWNEDCYSRSRMRPLGLIRIFNFNLGG